jgi:hypothetical protein
MVRLADRMETASGIVVALLGAGNGIIGHAAPDRLFAGAYP